MYVLHRRIKLLYIYIYISVIKQNPQQKENILKYIQQQENYTTKYN